MTITERVGASGSWSLDLDPDVPRSVLASLDPATAGFRQLVVTDVPIDTAGLADSAILNLARYSGLYRSLSGYTLSGAGLATLLEDEDGKGDIYGTAITYSGASLQTVVNAMAARVGLGAASAESLSGFTSSQTYVTPRQVLDAACAALGAEWRVRADQKIKAGSTGFLYGSNPALLILSDDEGGDELGLMGVRGQATLTTDLDDYATLVVYVTDRSGPSTVVSRATSYTRPDGAAWKSGAIVDGNPTDGTASTLAAAELGKLVMRRAWDVSTDADVAGVVPVGSPVYLWAPDSGVVDTATQVYFRGRHVYPVTLRLMGYTWPLRAGMGVYLRHKASTGATPTYQDLTPYVLPESGATRLEVGAIPRRA